jgi:hypothetical protein
MAATAAQQSQAGKFHASEKHRRWTLSKIKEAQIRGPKLPMHWCPLAWRLLGLYGKHDKPLKLSVVGFPHGREGYHRRPQLPSCLRFDVALLAQFLPRIL